MEVEMADFEALDQLARTQLGAVFAGLSVIDASDKSKWQAVWASVPTQAERDAFTALVTAADANAVPASEVQRLALIAAAQSLDGVSVITITATQVRTLVALLAWDRGWVRPNGTLRVRP
jgi:hypothetical protein